jgi:RNA polymerase sigma-70 factor (sigma-E family)
MDREAADDFREFVVSRSPALLVTAYLLTGDRGTAEDLLQTALLKTHRHWDRIRAGGNPEAYVRRVMANQRISWWRRRQLRVAESDRPLPDLPARDDGDRIEQRDELWRALRQVPPRTRAVLVLRYWEDLSEEETARILNCSVGTVKSQASRGLRRLRDVLAGSAGGLGSAGGAGSDGGVGPPGRAGPAGGTESTGAAAPTSGGAR